MQYYVRITKEGGRALAEFPDAPGCQTFAEPNENVDDVARDALEGWLELHLEDGDAPPRPSPRANRDGSALAEWHSIQVDLSLALRLQIRWARQDAGLSQAQLAERVGVTRQQISLLESPDANLTLSTLERVADALGMDVDITLRRRRPTAGTRAPSARVSRSRRA